MTCHYVSHMHAYTITSRKLQAAGSCTRAAVRSRGESDEHVFESAAPRVLHSPPACSPEPEEASAGCGGGGSCVRQRAGVFTGGGCPSWSGGYADDFERPIGQCFANMLVLICSNNAGLCFKNGFVFTPIFVFGLLVS